MKHTACNLKQKKAGENIKQWHKASNMQIRRRRQLIQKMLHRQSVQTVKTQHLII